MQLVAVNGVPITEGDVAYRQKTDPVDPQANVSPAKARLDTLRQLIVEVAAESAAGKILSENADLKRRVDTQRRQSLLAVAVDQKLAGLQVSDQEIDDFVSRNPQFFDQRKTYHFHEIVVGTVLQADEAKMRAELERVRKMGDLPPRQLGTALAWARQDGFGLSVANRWLGSEQIEPAMFGRILKMVATGNKIDLECHPKICRMLVLHDAYPDPLDPQAIRSAIARNLVAARQAEVGKVQGEALLQNASVEFTDPALAREASVAWNRKQFLTAPKMFRWVWVGQAVLLGLTSAFAIWLTRNAPSLVRKRAPRWSINLSAPVAGFLFGRGANVLVASGLVAMVVTGAVWVAVATSIGAFTQDLVLVSGYAAMIGMVIAGALRFTALPESLLRKVRYPLSGLLAVQTLLLLLVA